MLRILALTRYGALGASSRLRTLQYVPWLNREGIEVSVQALLPDRILTEKYKRGSYSLPSLLRAYAERIGFLLTQKARTCDLIWIEKEALPWLPAWFEIGLVRNKPYVLDYDDAIFHNYDRHGNRWVRLLMSRRIDILMSQASLVIAGNSYLASRARSAGARWIELVPTVLDLNRYPMKQVEAEVDCLKASPPRIAWIGSPATAHYLQLLQEPLSHLAQRFSFVFRVIGDEGFSAPGVVVETVPWAEATEAASLRECDIGVMPLLDSDWERGKCGYKLIQYMACGLPTVATNVGANEDIVQHGASGFLVSDTSGWIDALSSLLSDSGLREQMGRVGRRQVEDRYCLHRVAPTMVELLKTATAIR